MRSGAGPRVDWTTTLSTFASAGPPSVVLTAFTWKLSKVRRGAPAGVTARTTKRKTPPAAKRDGGGHGDAESGTPSPLASGRIVSEAMSKRPGRFTAESAKVSAPAARLVSTCGK